MHTAILSQTLAGRIATSLSTIETEHNFEYGVEFEIAMCEALRDMLADRYGLIRGYAVDRQGASAGDDILIYERQRFPTLALRHRDDFARKEFVPIEAIYCYLEAKHTVVLEGTGPQSLWYAAEQVQKVKSLVASRPPVLPGQLHPYLDLGSGITAPFDYPPMRNPVFGAVVARHVRKREQAPHLTDPKAIHDLCLQMHLPADNGPDMYILGNNLLLFPVLPKSTPGQFRYCSLFFIPNKSKLQVQVVDGIAFGVGFVIMMQAIDWIELRLMPWTIIVADAMRLGRE